MKGEKCVLQPNLTELVLKDTNMSFEAATYLSELLLSNTTLQKVNLEMNQISPALNADIAQKCKRNRLQSKQARVPNQQQELERLLTLTNNGTDCTFEKRTAFETELESV